MTVTTFQTATLATPEADVALANSPQPSRQLDLQVWTAVTALESPGLPSWRPILIAFPGLHHALSVRVHETAGDVAVEDPQTAVFGAGDDLDAAILDFQAALHDHLEVLADDDALAPPLQRQLEILRGYFNVP